MATSLDCGELLTALNAVSDINPILGPEYDLEEKKVCNKCKKEKFRYKDFDLRYAKKQDKYYPRSECKPCKRETELARKKANRDHNKEVNREYIRNNKEKIQTYQKQYRVENADKIKTAYIANHQANLQRMSNYRKLKENKMKRRIKTKERRDTDSVFRMTENLRVRVVNMLKQKKSENTDKYIGCTKSELRFWLEYQFTEEYSWENYGSLWHVDHVIPVAFFNLDDESEQKIAFNWTNLRPLKGSENMSKHDKILKDVIINHMDTVIQFISENSGYQASMETCWGRRLQLRYGKNPKDEEDFESFLKWTIRMQDAT